MKKINIISKLIKKIKEKKIKLVLKYDNWM